MAVFIKRIKLSVHTYKNDLCNHFIHRTIFTKQAEDQIILTNIYIWQFYVHLTCYRVASSSSGSKWKTFNLNWNSLKVYFNFQMSAEVRGFLSSFKFSGLSCWRRLQDPGASKLLIKCGAVSPEAPVWSGSGCWWWTGCAAGPDTGRTR